ILPELVSRDDLASASALNGIEFNLARAVGPALAGALIAVAGVGPAFAVNALSFVGVIVVVARWKRAPHKRTAPVETVRGATVAAVRYLRYSPTICGALVMQPARTRWSNEVVASAAVAILGVAIVATGRSRAMSALGVVMLVGGGAWIIFISLVSALIQSLAPDWVRARVLAMFML